MLDYAPSPQILSYDAQGKPVLAVQGSLSIGVHTAVTPHVVQLCHTCLMFNPTFRSAENSPFQGRVHQTLALVDTLDCTC